MTTKKKKRRAKPAPKSRFRKRPAPKSRFRKRPAPKSRFRKRPAPKSRSRKRPAPKSRSRKRPKTTTIAAAFAEIHALRAKLEQNEAIMAKQQIAMETIAKEKEAKQQAAMADILKENERLKAEAEALRAAPKPELPPREPTGEETMQRLRAEQAGLPEGFRLAKEVPEPAPVEKMRLRKGEIREYLATLAAQLGVEGFSVHPRAPYNARDNRWAEGELVINVPRGMEHRYLGANVGRIIGDMGAMKGHGIWITVGWYFDIKSGEERDRYLRYRGGYGVFAHAQHANTTGEMATNLLTAEGLADSYQRAHRGKKPVSLIFRLIWTVNQSPDKVEEHAWDRNGGQPPTV